MNFRAPLVNKKDRDIVWKAVEGVVEAFIEEGGLEKYIGKKVPLEKIKIWVKRIYNPEIFNLTKLTVTTSLVPEEWRELALAVHREIGERVAAAINQALEKAGMDTNYSAVSHADCVEVLHKGIDKISTTEHLLRDIPASSGEVIAIGDSPKDLAMAIGAKMRSFKTHFLFLGRPKDITEEIERLINDGGISQLPETVTTVNGTAMDSWNPGGASVMKCAIFLSNFIEAIRVIRDGLSLEEILEKVPGARTRSPEKIAGIK